ncbi:MAG: putative quinol monooxygenase [Bryobacteraceae bacterium]
MRRFLLILALAVSAFAQAERVTVVTHVDLMPPFVAEANKLLTTLATEARKEPGCVRYEVVVEPGRRNHVAVVSVWESQAAFDKHLTQASTRTFREKIQPMLGGPLDERIHITLVP